MHIHFLKYLRAIIAILSADTIHRVCLLAESIYKLLEHIV